MGLAGKPSLNMRLVIQDTHPAVVSERSGAQDMFYVPYMGKHFVLKCE